MSDDANLLIEDDDEEASEYEVMRATLVMHFDALFPIIVSGEWTTWSEEEQVDFAETIRLGRKVYENLLRPKFDAAIHTGHANGTVSDKVKPLRAERDPDGAKPGRKAPTAREILERELAK